MTLITGETWGEDVPPVRAYLLNEAQQPLSVLRRKLDEAREEFRAAIRNVSETQAQFTPGSGEGEDAWGIAEVLRHIASVEPIMVDRIRLLGTGQATDGLTRTHPGYLEAVETRQLGDLVPALERSYAALGEVIAEIDGSERLETTTAHRRFGELNCRGWVALHTLHLRDHARQIERIKQLTAYPG